MIPIKIMDTNAWAILARELAGIEE